MSNRCRIDRNGVKFFLYSKCRVGFETKWGKEEGEAAREREREREDDVFLHGLFRKKKRDGSVDRYVCMESGRKERERERELEAASNATRKREREREREREGEREKR